jgi:NmrA-like family protein
MTSNRAILITGVTGNQGGAVAQALQGTGFYVPGLTRKPDSERAAALARQGVDIVKGDLDDEATLRRALAGRGASSACRTRWRRASSGKRRRASVWRRSRARPASHTTSPLPGFSSSLAGTVNRALFVVRKSVSFEPAANEIRAKIKRPKPRFRNSTAIHPYSMINASALRITSCEQNRPQQAFCDVRRAFSGHDSDLFPCGEI